MLVVSEQPNVEFTCPKCGSHYWGTTELKSGGTGNCHGTLNPITDCDFTWPRSEDNKYFGPIRNEADRVGPIRFNNGDRVCTIGKLENRDFTEETIRTRRANAKGTVTGYHDSHGLCYVVLHDDGIESCYDPDELMRIQ